MKKIATSLWIWIAALSVGVAVAQPESARPPAPAPAAPAPAPLPAPKHFSHTDHRTRGVDVEKCASCHAIDAKGQVLAPAAQGHAPCLDAKCHATDFLAVGDQARKRSPAQFAKASAFCLGCHETVPWPWKKPTTRVLRSYENSREHHVEMNHYEHTQRTKVTGCRGCHVVDDRSFGLVAGTPGHAQCGTCHNAKDYPDLTMKACGSCHQRESRASYLQGLGIAENRPKTDVRACQTEGHEQVQKRQGRPVPCFQHERVEHRTLNGSPVQCVSCHFIVGDKSKWAKRRYQTLADLQLNPIIWNAKDQQHESCGRVAACHKRDVDPVSGARCNLCHAEKDVF
ncbi:MAG TPA: hypothetical protein VN253_28070 [Kofleriaceae bacterium]|nr:hypothetical protein [Kofleriaceae bacterium]